MDPSFEAPEAVVRLGVGRGLAEERCHVVDVATGGRLLEEIGEELEIAGESIEELLEPPIVLGNLSLIPIPIPNPILAPCDVLFQTAVADKPAGGSDEKQFVVGRGLEPMAVDRRGVGEGQPVGADDVDIRLWRLAAELDCLPGLGGELLALERGGIKETEPAVGFTIGRIEGEDPLARPGGLARVLEITEEEIGPIPERRERQPVAVGKPAEGVGRRALLSQAELGLGKEEERLGGRRFEAVPGGGEPFLRGIVPGLMGLPAGDPEPFRPGFVPGDDPPDDPARGGEGENPHDRQPGRRPPPPGRDRRPRTMPAPVGRRPGGGAAGVRGTRHRGATVGPRPAGVRGRFRSSRPKARMALSTDH